MQQLLNDNLLMTVDANGLSISLVLDNEEDTEKECKEEEQED